MVDGTSTTPAASPYATGGGGTVLEHRFGAVLLSSLLTADPVAGLGDDVDPAELVFQASAFSPVDDLVLSGRGADGELRRLSIAVRRAPSLVPSSAESVQLMSTFVRVLADHWEEVRRGSWRLQLASASPNRDVQQLRALADIARATPDDASFRSVAAEPARASRPVRERLVHVDRLVAQAAADAGEAAQGIAASELTWRLLSVLSTRELRLEGTDISDRSACVARLRDATSDKAAASADLLFARLAELSAQYAPAGAQVNETTLRRDLQGRVVLARSSRHGEARHTLDRLGERLRGRTRSRLGEPPTSIEVERSEARDAVVAAMRAVSAHGPPLVVCGEPDVGKSALMIKAVDALGAEAALTLVSLRDLPGTSLETESLLGVPLAELLAGEEVKRIRLLVVDGAESVLEGRGALLTDLATAAMTAGLGVVAVARSDAAAAVGEALRQVDVNITDVGVRTPIEHEVPRLTEEEIDEITAHLPAVARLGRERRARWLLGRPGLTDLLLRGNAAQALPDGALSEADVFAAVWFGLVRQSEMSFGDGPTPDAREHALLLLARELLLGNDGTRGAQPDALPSLRSDGLLLAAGPTSAWNPGDQFASDLVRDFCVARLLIVDGMQQLLSAGGPRWALRAARLACQAAIAQAGVDCERARTALQPTFDALAAQHGARWAALPLEAMLTLGSAYDVISRAWPDLADGESQRLITLLRLSQQRYVHAGIADVIVLGPLVEVVLEHGLVGAEEHGRRDALLELVREVVLAWLRGESLTNSSASPLRARVRDRLLNDEDPDDEFVVEAIALLGADLDDASEDHLRRLAADGGGDLGPAVESVVAGRTMAEHRPELLLALTDAYYIERPGSDSRGLSGYSRLDEGIRHHTARAGFGVPMAGWWFGPFWCLLNAQPVEALRLINELLDHAAAIRMAIRDSLFSDADPRAGQEDARGLTLPLPSGPRWCIGNEQAWTWYRGSSNGPYPAMSALMAVEMFADHLVRRGMLPGRVSELLLRDCHNLAMPGLVVGFLVRHLERITDELDPWLAHPEVWELEFGRTAIDGHLQVQGPDPTELAGLARRRYSMRDAATELMAAAVAADDPRRLEALGKIADRLVANNGRGAPTDDGNPTALLTRAGWASCLRSENYRLTTQADGTTLVEFEPPEDLLAELAPSHAAIARGQTAWRLATQYGIRADRRAPTDTLASDLTFARELVEQPPEAFGPSVAEAAGAVAATALVRHAHEAVALPRADLAWAAELLAEIALAPVSGRYPGESARYLMGATRSAACGLPALLFDLSLPPLAAGQLERALMACARSPADEVRRMLAETLGPVWEAPCDAESERGECRHALALRLVGEMIRDCQLGDWDPTGQHRELRPLAGDPVRALADVKTDSLLINHLAAPIAAAMTAASSGCCISSGARHARDELLTAYRRGALHWDEKGYGSHTGDEFRPIARALFTTAAAGDREPLEQCVREFAQHPGLIEQLLHNMLLACTYDGQLRAGLASVWPPLMRTALSAGIAQPVAGRRRRRGERAVTVLIPRPSIDVADRDPNGTLQIAQREWIDPTALTELIEDWIALVRGDAHAVDALVGLIDTGAPRWQASTGLEWIEGVIAGEYASVALYTYLLPAWLQRLRAAGKLEAADTARFHRIIDGLVAAGDHRVLALQRAEE